MDSGHILNKKVRLIYNEFQADGYYIWSCILDYAYGKWGWYFDTSDEEEMELFASEYCRQKLSKIREVITGCLRRGLFDEAVFNVSKVLTSEMMQEVFVYATADRRNKGSVFEMQRDWLLLHFDEIPRNLTILPPNNGNSSPEEYTDKTIQDLDKTIQDGAVGTATPAQAGIENTGKQPSVAKKESPARRPPFTPPTLEEAKAYFLKKMGNQASAKCWPEDVCHGHAQEFWLHYEANGWKQGNGNTPRPIVSWEAAASQWISRELKGKFSNQVQPVQKTAPPPQAPMPPVPPPMPKIEQEINYLYERYCEDPDKLTVISVEFLHYDHLKSKGLVLFGQEKANEIRAKAQAHYAEKSMSVDELTLTRMMKKMGVLEVFSEYNRQGKTTIF